MSKKSTCAACSILPFNDGRVVTEGRQKQCPRIWESLTHVPRLGTYRRSRLASSPRTWVGKIHVRFGPTTRAARGTAGPSCGGKEKRLTSCVSRCMNEQSPALEVKQCVVGFGKRASRTLLQNVKMGNPFNRQTSKSFRVCGSNPFAESISITALSAAVTVRYVSSLKSACPGVSRRFNVNPAYWKLSAVLDIEIPRCCSISIQSDVADFAPLRDRTAPASLIAPP